MSERFHLGQEPLQEYQQALESQQLSQVADARIQEAMRAARAAQRSPATRRMTWAMVGAFALMLVLGGGAALLSQQVPHQGTRMGGLLVVRGAVIFAPTTQAENALQCETRRCRLRFPERRTRIKLHKRANIQRVKQQLVFLQGKARFGVSAPSQGASPLKLKVSHGVIELSEVSAANFTIQQAKDHGQITLHHGQVRFRYERAPAADAFVQVRAGETLRWPLRRASTRRPRGLRPAPPRARMAQLAPPVRRLLPARRALPVRRMLRRRPITSRRSATTRPPVRPSALVHRSLPRPTPLVGMGGVRVARAIPTPQRPKTPVPVAPQVRPVAPRKLIPRLAFARWLQELSQLRSQAKYAQAADRLRQHLKALFQPPHIHGNHIIRERLNYELGSLLTHHLKKRSRACVHWHMHRRMFRHSRRYDQEIQALLKQLKCRSLR